MRVSRILDYLASGWTIPEILENYPDSISFVQNALNAAQDHPDVLPRSFSTPKT